MRGRAALLALLVAGCATGGSEVTAPTPPERATTEATTGSTPTTAPATELPEPDLEGTTTLESALSSRRSVREFADEDLTPIELGQLLWAAQGTTSPEGGRTAPSAGALYPLEVYVATADGLWHYLPEGHRIEQLGREDLRGALADAAVEQEWVADAPAVLVVVGVEPRTAEKYGTRAERYVAIEAGHAAQNVLLQATALGLVSTPVGALDEARVRGLLGVPDDHTPLLLLPVGHPRTAP